MITLKKIYFSLFLIGFFFFPFNDFDGIPALGEYANESGSYFFILGFLVLCIDSLYKGKIAIPYRDKIFQILLLFLVWCVVTTILNGNVVVDSYYKQTGGVYRFLRQYISLLLAAFIFVILFWNSLKDLTSRELLIVIRKVFLYNLVFAFVYGIFEVLISVFNVYAVMPIMQLFNFFPFLDVNFESGGRISSIGYEVPSLGNYLITVSGWMFSYIYTEKSKWRFVPILMVLFLTFFSGSRTALINITLQLAMFIYLLYSIKSYRKTLLVGLQFVAVISVLTVVVFGNQIVRAVDKKVESLNFSANLTKSISNQSRFGMQYASLEVFKENPIIGVGFGQETYHKIYHYPPWATHNNYEFRAVYQNQNITSFPTSYNIYTRLLAETGIIGVAIFLAIIFFCFSRSIFLWRNAENDQKTLGMILLVSFVGLCVNWMQMDFFRQYGFWLCVVILIKVYDERKKSIILDQPQIN